MNPWWTPIAIVVGSAVLGYLLGVLALKRVAALVTKTASELDDVVLKALRRPLPFWVLLAGVAMAMRSAPVSEQTVAMVDRLCALALVVSLTVATAGLGTALLARFTRRSGAAVATTTLAQNVVRVSILGLGGLLVLSNLGVSITPLLTALGVGSLAVALALQPTLTNLFAGVQLAVARPIRVGDFVELETGAKGYVEDIGWRATRIRELPNNLVVVPNARLVEMVVINYDMPQPEQAALVQVGVSYGSDLEVVERVTREVARDTLREVEGGVAEFDPFIRFHTFGASSIDFTVILRVKQFVDRYLVTHEFIKRLKARYDAVGIEIPFPHLTLFVGEGAPRGRLKMEIERSRPQRG